MKDITAKLKSQNAVVSVLVLALLAQMPHAQYVFFANNHDHGWFGWIQSWGGAIALEVAVLVFVIRGNTTVSWGFASFSVAMNLIYYYDGSVAWYVPRASWLLSAGLPVAIALYSHEVAEKQPEAQPPTQPDATEDAPPAPEKVAPVVAPVVEDATPDATTQPVAIAEEFQTQLLDEMNATIIDAIRNGHCTPYAISKQTGITVTTLKRTDKATGKVSGRLPKLCEMGLIHNSSGADGSEYRLAGE